MGLVCILTSEAWIELLVRISLTVGFPASTVVAGALDPEEKSEAFLPVEAVRVLRVVEDLLTALGAAVVAVVSGRSARATGRQADG